MSQTTTRVGLGRRLTYRPSPAAALLELLLIWLERSRQRHQLRELDDRALKDIGLSRADVESEASKPFWLG